MNATDITIGATLYTQDNVALGTIEEVWTNTAAHGFLPISRTLLQDYGPIKGNSALFTTTDAVLQVRESSRLGEDAGALEVHLTEVARIDSSAVAITKYPATRYDTTTQRSPALRAA